jgi:hypothetical protein
MNATNEQDKRIRGIRKFRIADDYVKIIRRRVRRPIPDNTVEEILLRKARTPRALIKAWIEKGILTEVDNEKIAPAKDEEVQLNVAEKPDAAEKDAKPRRGRPKGSGLKIKTEVKKDG